MFVISVTKLCIHNFKDYLKGNVLTFEKRREEEIHHWYA